MAQNSPTTSRDDIVEAVSNFYAFLTTHPFLPATAIQTPPPEGWPEEHREVFRKMGKSEEVIDLLAHLPYIDDNDWLWFHDTTPINYISSLNLTRIDANYASKRYLFEPQEENLGPHVFSLTNGRLYGTWLLLDTQAGTITEFSVLNGPTIEGSEEERANGSTWRLYPTKSIREFFAACQQKMQGGTSSTA